MERFKNLFLIIVAVSAIIFTSCQNDPNPVEPQDFQNTTPPRLNKYSIPAGATFVSATFNINILVPTNQNINVHRITSPWEELVVTWNNFGGSYAPEIIGSFNASIVGWNSVDVTTLVGSWLNGTNPNYGLLLDQVNQTYPRNEYDTREYNFSAGAAYLEICYSLNGSVVCDTTRNIGDTYIYERIPDDNNGFKGEMYTGWGDEWDNEKQALIQFDIEPTTIVECTRPAIYWERHTQYGPEPRDLNWDLILPNGESSEFFLSGKIYYQVLKTSQLGNDYYYLANQYIAAKLNVLSGASIPAEVLAAFNSATEFFNAYTPTQVGNWNFWHPIRRQFRFNAYILIKYNWGIIGPGACGSCGH